MEGGKATNKPHGDKGVDYQNNGGWCLGHCLPYIGFFSIHNFFNIHPAESENIDAEQSR